MIGLSRHKKTIAIMTITLIALLVIASATPIFRVASQVITEVFVTNTNANPVPTKLGYIYKTYFSSYTFDSMGHIHLTGILNIKGFSKVSIMILEFPMFVGNMTADVTMGKISGTTLASRIASFIVPTRGPVSIRTYNIVGPELSITLFGPANIKTNIQAWVYIQ